MLKKKTFKDDFKDDPALQFITPTEEVDDTESLEEEGETNKKIVLKKRGKEKTAAENRQLSLPDMPMKLKEAKASGLVQPKSRRLNLLMQQSVYDKGKAAAERRGVSFNEYIHSLVEEAEN